MDMSRHPVRVAVRLADASDDARIEAWLRTRADSTPFHRPAWGRAVAAGCRQSAHFLIAETALATQTTFGPSEVEGRATGGGSAWHAPRLRSGRTGTEAESDLIGLLPLTEVHSPLFGRALVSAGFAVDGGILAADDATAAALADAAIALAGRLSCPTVELRGGRLPQGWTIKTDAHAGFVRPLGPDDDAELLAIPRKQRAEVRRALGFDLQVGTGRSLEDRAAHYAVYAESVRNLGTPVFPRALFEAVLDGFGDDADILTVRHDGRPIASVLSLYHHGAVMPYWGGGTAAARTWRANDLMYFALMRHARARGCDRFDFGRSKTGSGAYAFKKNWGFEPRPLSYAIRTADGQPPRDVNPLSPKYRAQIALWQRLPLSVANRLGPLIARGLG